VIPSKDPLGRDIYWFSPKPTEQPEAGTDGRAVDSGAVSITPLRLDLTDDRSLASLRAARVA
jgi:5'-nucleotidase